MARASGPASEAPTGSDRTPAHILVAVADEGRRGRIRALLEHGHRSVDLAGDGKAALAILASRPVDVMVLDLDLPRISGMDLLRALPSLHSHVEVLTVAPEPRVESAVAAMRLGARDLICCPCDGDYLVLAVDRAVADARARRELAHVRSTPDRGRVGEMVGDSAAIRHVLDLVGRVAPTRATVLITGETGTGKELVARAIHAASDRRNQPFVVVGCSAIPPTLMESELFGHVKGSFTGAIQSRKGLIEEAHRGTLFLDEIGTISLETQVKLLRVIEERRLQRVGCNTMTAVDFRVIAATNEELAGMVGEGRFREDLYFRLNVFPIHLPPLRKRTDDVVRLADHFLDRYAREYQRDPPPLSPRALSRMLTYPWPGNVRELQNVMERAVVLGSVVAALSMDLALDPDGAPPPERILERALERSWTLDRLEREYLLAVLDRNDGRRSAAAEELGVDRRTIHRKLRRYREEGLLPGAVGSN